MKRRATDTGSVIALRLYRQACERDLRQTTAAAMRARAEGDYRTLARMLKRALTLSTKIAKLYGVPVRGEAIRSVPESDAEHVAREVIKATDKARGKRR